MTRSQLLKLGAAALVVSVAVALGRDVAQSDARTHRELFADRQTITQLQTRVATLEIQSGLQADWPTIAARIEPSVVVIATRHSLGSAWVAHTDSSGSDLVTNFHVVEDAWSSGTVKVDVRHDDRILTGTIMRVDPSNDLAVVHISQQLSVLTTIDNRPKLGSPVMAVGSPLGLTGTVSIGVVSGFRSLEGSDYIQFSAPISPGNSGGPVVDSHGRVVAVATAKLVGTGVEALSLAIPVHVACLKLVACTLARAA
jgi:S1-C subfamily serine protease